MDVSGKYSKSYIVFKKNIEKEKKWYLIYKDPIKKMKKPFLKREDAIKALRATLGWTRCFVQDKNGKYELEIVINARGSREKRLVFNRTLRKQYLSILVLSISTEIFAILSFVLVLTL